jgi:hypothetical protein
VYAVIFPEYVSRAYYEGEPEEQYGGHLFRSRNAAAILVAKT